MQGLISKMKLLIQHSSSTLTTLNILNSNILVGKVVLLNIILAHSSLKDDLI